MFVANSLSSPESKTKWRLLVTVALVSFIFLTSQTLAQNNTVSSGAVATGSSGTASYSVGQVFYISSINDNGKVIQGLQQPYDVAVITGVNDLQINLKVTAYPNPAPDYLTLSIDNTELSQFNYQLLDMQGKILRQEKFGNRNINIKVSDFPNGIYILKVFSKQKQLKTFKIIKAN